MKTLNTKVILSSNLPFDHKQFKGQDKVMAICEHLGATQYINPIGGTDLYSKTDFAAKGIDLSFIKSRLFPYPQIGPEFVPWLSIVDPILHVGKEATKSLLSEYDLV